MSCNCKKQPNIINNLKSKDHLNIAFDVYNDVIAKKKKKYDELDQKQIFYAYFSVYPNSVKDVTLENAINQLTWVYQNYYGK